jgi:hypothetical protein
MSGYAALTRPTLGVEEQPVTVIASAGIHTNDEICAQTAPDPYALALVLELDIQGFQLAIQMGALHPHFLGHA